MHHEPQNILKTGQYASKASKIKTSSNSHQRKTSYRSFSNSICLNISRVSLTYLEGSKEWLIQMDKIYNMTNYTIKTSPKTHQG